MAKKKKNQSVMAVNQYEHNLNKNTIVTDQNSFMRKGSRYTISGDDAIHILTGKRLTLPPSVKAEIEAEMFNFRKHEKNRVEVNYGNRG